MRRLLLAILCSACAEQSFPMPMTAGQLARLGGADALVAYLGQEDASSSVCDVRSAGPHVPVMDGDAAAAVTEALGEGRIQPAVWRRCADGIARSAPPDAATALLDAVAREAGERLLDLRLPVRRFTAIRDQLLALIDFYLERPTAAAPHPRARAALADDVRTAIAGRPLPPPVLARAIVLQEAVVIL
jgi:hypothetical protein